MAPATDRVPVVVGIDVGSTNTKVVAVRDDGVVVARAARPTPREEADPSLDADVLVRLVEDLVLETCGDRFAIAALATAGVGEDGVLVDEALRPLTRALAWFDPRRGRIFRTLRESLPHLDRTGVEADASRTLVGWAWAARQLEGGSGPHAHAHAHDQESRQGRGSVWLSLTDLAGARWTGTPFMSDTVAARTAAWDANARAWIPEHVAASLGDRATLPRVVSTGSVVGPIISDRFRDGAVLAADAVVVAGGHDHPIGGWAIDQLAAGAVLDSMGTAEVVVAQARGRVQRTATMDVAPGIRQPGTTLLCVAELARNVQWASLDPEVAGAITAMATGAIEPTDHLLSDAFVPGSRGGGRPRYASDAPADPRARASAVLGALARAGRDAIREVETALPTGATVYAAGGWSRAEGWLRIKERFGTATMAVPEPEVTAVGAALLAASAIGWTVPSGVALGTVHKD